MNTNRFNSKGKRHARKVALLAAMAPAAAFAFHPAQAQLVDVSECVSVADKLTRLACYDSLARREPEASQAATSASAAPIASVKPAPTAAKPAPQAQPAATMTARAPDPLTTPAGKYQSAAEKAKSDADGAPKKAEKPRLLSTLSRHQRLNSGKIAVELENGQVWRQLDTKRVRIKNGESLEVEIEESSFGGYWMTIEGAGAPFRVERVR